VSRRGPAVRRSAEQRDRRMRPRIVNRGHPENDKHGRRTAHTNALGCSAPEVAVRIVIGV
jgi:hypothetical protein